MRKKNKYTENRKTDANILKKQEKGKEMEILVEEEHWTRKFEGVFIEEREKERRKKGEGEGEGAKERVREGYAQRIERRKIRGRWTERRK